MKYIFVLLFFLLSSFVAKSECLFINDTLKVTELSELRSMAYKVMDAEGGRCEQIEDITLRSSCQCKYRKKPLIQFRINYKSVIKTNPNYIGREVCFSKGKQGITVVFTGYEHISKWCM